MSLKLSALAVLLSVVGAHGASGIYMKEETKNLDGRGAASSSTIYLEKQRVRVDSDGGDAGKQVFVYIGGEVQRLYFGNPDEGSYRTFSKQELEQMMSQISDQMSQIRAKMDAQLKNMDPKQREMFEKMMRGRMPGMDQQQVSKTVYRKVESGVAVGEWQCDKYDGLRDGEKVTEILSTAWSTFGLTPADFTVFRDLASMFEGLSKQVSVDMYKIGSDNPASDEEFAGVPVRRISFRDGQPSMQHDVTEVSRKDFDDDIFKVFDGMKKLENPQMPTGGMPGMRPPR